MTSNLLACILSSWLGPIPGAAGDGTVPGAAAAPSAEPGAEPSAEIDRQLARLQGHRVRRTDGALGFIIEDAAGDGAPWVGTVERRGSDLWLVGASRAGGPPAAPMRLVGRLATPRIAGPGYRVWIIGDAGPSGSLRPRRLGVLAPPQRGRP